jgi:hypothetical protein
MAEYGILYVMTRGTQWLEGAVGTVANDPVLLWGGGALLVLLAVWALKPSR